MQSPDSSRDQTYTTFCVKQEILSSLYRADYLSLFEQKVFFLILSMNNEHYH